MIRSAWAEERLTEAFAVRAAAVPRTPIDLLPAIREALERTPRPRGRSRLLNLAAAAAVMFAVGVVGLAVATQSGRPVAGSPGPIVRKPSPDATAPASTSGLQSLLDHSIAVSDAIDVRDTGLNNTELAVAGFLSSVGGPIPCPYAGPSPSNPTRLVCEQALTWFMEDPELLLTTTSNSMRYRHPAGPAIQPSFALVDASAIAGGLPDPTVPLELTLVGHFDDRRATLCQNADSPPCGDTFVVDRIEAVGDARQPVSTLMGNTRWDEAKRAEVTVEPASTPEAMDRLVTTVDPGVEILSRMLLTGDRLGAIEPALIGDSELTGQPLVWIETTVGVRDRLPVARTYLVVDGTTAVREITTTGAAGVVPVPSIGPHIAVQLGSSGGSPVVAEVYDLAEILIGARPLTAAEADRVAWIRKVDPAGPATVEVADVPDHSGEIAVRWLAPDCRPALNVYGFGNNPGTVAVLPVVMTPACSLRTVERTVVLQFRDPVRAAIVDVLSLSGG